MWYLFKFNNEETIFTVNIEQFLLISLVFTLLAFNKEMPRKPEKNNC